MTTSMDFSGLAPTDAISAVPTIESDRLRLYGLLYVDRRHERHANLRLGKGDPVDVYVACASLTSQTAARCGESFTLITNDEGAIRASVDRLSLPPLSVTSIDFGLAVPKAIPFFQAHQKISVLKAFGEGTLGANVGLVDIDVAFVRPVALAIAPDVLTAYDITDRVQSDDLGGLDRLRGVNGSTTWFGGELIAGPAALFWELHRTVTALLPRYFEELRSFGHIGDETVVSAALNELRARGAPIRDAGGDRVIARWWSARTARPEPSFAAVADARILHLPADKPLLAAMARRPDYHIDFVGSYRRAVCGKVRLRQAVTWLERAAGRRGKFAPRLG